MRRLKILTEAHCFTLSRATCITTLSAIWRCLLPSGGPPMPPSACRRAASERDSSRTKRSSLPRYAHIRYWRAISLVGSCPPARGVRLGQPGVGVPKGARERPGPRGCQAHQVRVAKTEPPDSRAPTARPCSTAAARPTTAWEPTVTSTWTPPPMRSTVPRSSGTWGNATSLIGASGPSGTANVVTKTGIVIVPANGQSTVYADCPASSTVTGGGFAAAGPALTVTESTPTDHNGTQSWVVEATNTSTTTSIELVAEAQCAS